MGLFNKKKPTEENAAIEQETVVSENTESLIPRRFSLVVESITSMLDGDGVVVSGELSGNAKVGDVVYIYVPGQKAVEAEIKGLETTQDEKTVIVSEAEDAFSSFQLSLKEKTTIKKYAVISNQLQPEKIEPGMIITNPALDGIIKGMPKFGKDNTFHATVAYFLSHAHFITPVKIEESDDANKKVGFYMLKSTVKLTGTPEGKDSLVLPLFTDGVALRNWKGLAKENEQIRTQILSFPNIYGMLTKGQAYAGIAINPFDKTPCTLPIPYLETITKTPGYQRDFGAEIMPKDESNNSSADGKKEVKIMLGVPKDTEETREIRDMLAAYGEDEADIKSINLMVKIEESTKTVRYLILLEMDVDKETAKAHMDSLYSQLKPLAHEIKQIEYAIKGRIPGIDQIAEANKEKMLVYSAE